MLFPFLKYLQPTNYFSVLRKNDRSIFPVASQLDSHILEQLEAESTYQTEHAKQYDLSWQAIQKGYIGDAETIDEVEPTSLIDNYTFIRRYFNKAWVSYVLLLRLFSFKNPFKELKAWYVTKAVKRSSYLNQPLDVNNWNDFKSNLIEEQPMVTVVIPTLNRYEYLKDVLEDLEKQDYETFEVIVVDQSEPFDADFYSNFNLDLHLIHQKEKALWLARNTAVKCSKGSYLLLFDDDSRVDVNWISEHLKCLDFFKAQASSGVSISKVGAKVPLNYSFFKVSDQLDTGNVLIKKEVFKDLGLFDRQFEKQRMGDGEYGMRMYLNNYLNISNPYAKRLHLKVGTGGLRQMGSWDAFRTKNLFDPRPIPSVLYFYRSYFGSSRSKLALLRTVPISIMPYKFKKNKAMLVLGGLVSLVVLPLVLFQVRKSWKLSRIKLDEGPKVETLSNE
ncbi:glycosyltransferase family 2 protein [Psychroserpens luteolus]|uniref:glycosyltransferase family 2 protein n=1 Tax=Psychroserpens luteolus TaxID=2855840 RepID=UPI001E377203|nr:glycosyltransferase family A protein [Psychroserpens luteolus]MCD2259816.1 glycosyltransferase family 2 protein [Psychroserpens luteolus]